MFFFLPGCIKLFECELLVKYWSNIILLKYVDLLAWGGGGGGVHINQHTQHFTGNRLIRIQHRNPKRTNEINNMKVLELHQSTTQCFTSSTTLLILVHYHIHRPYKHFVTHTKHIDHLRTLSHTQAIQTFCNTYQTH